MPHFIAKNENIKLPLQEDGFSFVEMFVDEKYPSQILILTTYQNQTFFIKRSKHSLGFLFKGEKNTKPSLVGHLKNALLTLSKYCEVISHNLSNNTPRQISKNSFLLGANEVLDHFHKNFALEIGFGSGRHLLNLAKQNPQTKFLGVEIHTPSIQQVLRQIELLEIKNLFITNTDARILTSILPSNSCEKIYLHFPVPWNKKPHRRVLTKNFLIQALRVLAPKHTLHLRTDDEIYFQDALSLGLESPQAHLTINKNLGQEIVSKYEARWLKKEKNIYDVEFQSLINDDPLCLSYDFSFPASQTFDLPTKTLEKDFFIHLNARLFSKNSILLNISFGDFNWPNTKFIIIDKTTKHTSFLGEKPLAIPANIKAHKKLVAYLENR
ncbi:MULTISPECIES: tRNA (guanosine(46)-N7)-methyltransferase TrmB [unclassified Helicobacter]|uniref:tRNA (guanosine(46)-N7)-methyltransferase TrmB n=1 Tax=unclassified Helicobacter TaxID=2593540 RepID=UPI000CF171E7|nr:MULTISPECIES: tRNA (guanosine(46)-N7)-methyltransferase TrmB [unclassified Helicobacter]